MSETSESLRRKIASAGDLQSVVRTMKAVAASSIGQFENAADSLDDYYRTVQLALAACLRQTKFPDHPRSANQKQDAGWTCAVVFGSDQGLVGQFNETMASFVVETLDALPGKKSVWVIGERVHARLAETSLQPDQNFTLPNSVGAIAPLIGQILIKIEAHREMGKISQILLFHNRPKPDSIYAPVVQRLLPLDAAWHRELAEIRWPTVNLPEVIGNGDDALFAFVREYLFVSLFRACAESLASENASRLAAMQRAEKNIDELLEELTSSFHRLRQSGIDEELFDVVAGFEALSKAG